MKVCIAAFTGILLTAMELNGQGSYVYDQTGIFSNALIAVTGGSQSQGGEVWQIASNGIASNLARITNSGTPHLEGVITLTNDVQKWGPWAGKIITGAEAKIPPLIHAIGTNGIVESFALGIAPEDFDLIPPNQDLYLPGFNEGKIYKLSKSLLTNYVGDLLITQEAPPLVIVHWDPINSAFTVRAIPPPPGIQGFEHVTFAPINLPSLPCPP